MHLLRGNSPQLANGRVISGGSAPFSPAYLPGGFIWYKANDGPTISKIGNAVSEVTDKFGNSINATQGSGALKPTIGVVNINGRDALGFSGSQYMAIASGAYSLTGGDATIFTVSRSDANADSHILGGDAGKLTFQYKTVDSLRYGLENGGYVDRSIADMTQPAILSVRRSGTGAGTCVPRKNGVALGAATTSANSTLTSLWMGRSPSYGQTLTGAIGEVIIYNRALAVSEQNLVNNYLSAEWEIAVTEIV